MFLRGIFSMSGREDREPGEVLPQWLTTGDMARHSQTTLRTVRFYEAEGLIVSQARERGNHRRFPLTELFKLQAIVDLREAGLSLQEIKDLIGLKGQNATAASASCQLSTSLSGRIDELERRVATLKRVRDELGATLRDIEPCRDCTVPGFPTSCFGCDRMLEPNLSRATHLLWKN
jgi:DNA-binding transcriptional MerR regulator